MVAGGRPFEVTTFRRDVETFGRRAVVAFTTDIAEDAARRDFTMNALYARPDGTLVDPLGGLPDLRAGRVRFVGDPARRIAEDYLRILRFFRIHAWYGDPAAGLDPDGLAACAAARDGLARLSRERVGAEMRKLLAGARPRARPSRRWPRPASSPASCPAPTRGRWRRSSTSRPRPAPPALAAPAGGARLAGRLGRGAAAVARRRAGARAIAAALAAGGDPGGRRPTATAPRPRATPR